MNNIVKVDIWSDIACPWCIVGKRRFETAAAQFAETGGEVEVEYHSFELAPDTPVDYAGSEVDFLVTHKGMAAAQVEQMLVQMTELAATEGLAFDYAALQHTNTVKAHELLHFAKSKDRQLDMSERLFKAYFEEGRHVGRVDDLADLAAEIGLDRDEALAALTSEEFLPAVNADKQQAIAYGISGVPFFVIDGRYGVSGAQEPASFVEVLQTAAREGASA
ncbi:MAG: DsbA family oxidoreductase [Aeromicrobium sp.]